MWTNYLAFFLSSGICYFGSFLIQKNYPIVLIFFKEYQSYNFMLINGFDLSVLIINYILIVFYSNDNNNNKSIFVIMLSSIRWLFKVMHKHVMNSQVFLALRQTLISGLTNIGK